MSFRCIAAPPRSAGRSWPDGSRLIVRRERPHPGAQLSFTDHDGYRFQAILTDQPDQDIAVLERRHRQRAPVEDRIRDDKDTGLAKVPFKAFALNEVWPEIVMLAHDLIARSVGRRSCVPRALRSGPKTPFMSSGEVNGPEHQAICVVDMSARRRGGRESTHVAVVSDVDDLRDRLNISCQRRGPRASTCDVADTQIRARHSSVIGILRTCRFQRFLRVRGAG